MEKLVSVVVPMYYEQDVINETYKRLVLELNKIRYRYEIVFVDDGSLDNTYSIVKKICQSDKNIKLIKLSKNFGHQNAVTAGIKNASGDCVILIDADLQDPPSLIHEFITYWENGFHVVYGKRNVRNGESFFKIYSAKMFYKFLNFMSDTPIPTDTGDFRLMDRVVVDAFLDMPERSRFIRGMVSWTGFKQVPIMYDRDKRYAGQTKYPFKKMMKFASNGIISFSTKPLKLLIYIGSLSVIVSFIILLYALFLGVFKHEYLADGWASIMVTITFMGGINLLSIGVLGSYVGRIYDEVKERPLYIIEDMINYEK